MRLLVTGGAGYIGSVVAAQLLAAGHEVVVLDDLSRGHAGADPARSRPRRGLARRPRTRWTRRSPAGSRRSLHFAALSLVAESVEHPERYWHNNVVGSRNLLDAMRAAGVRRLVFSSTAATYGEPERVPITEDDPTAPVNAYGASKLAVDLMIRDECVAHGLAAASLRYFNVAGREPRLRRGPRAGDAPDPARAAGRGRHARRTSRCSAPTTTRATAPRCATTSTSRTSAAAHLLALDRVRPGAHRIFNLGTGDGYTVREVIEAARRVTGRAIPVREEGRRAGRSAAARGGQRARPRRAGLGARARAGRDDRRRLGLAPGPPARLRGLTSSGSSAATASTGQHRGRRAGVDHREPLRLGGRERVVGGGDRRRRTPRSSCSSRSAAPPRRSARASAARASIRSSSVRSGARPPVRERVEPPDRLDAQPAPGALVGERGVDEAVEQHPAAGGEERLEPLLHQLGARRGVEQRLGARVARRAPGP